MNAMAAGSDAMAGADALAMPMFSLVLATYGRSDVLVPMLDSLLGQTCTDFELIVADQNPDDRVVPYLQRLVAAGVPVLHCRLPSPNLSAARNVGISRARGRLVAFPDDDCWYEPDCLARVAAASVERADVGGWVVRWVETEPDGPRPPHRLEPADFRRFRSGDASSISLFLDAGALRRLEGFDPRIGVGRYYGAGEETDLVMRFLGAGLSLHHLPDARVHHHFDPSTPAFSRAALRARKVRERGVGAMYAKHRLETSVIARGLLAPVFKGLASRRPLSGVAFACSTVLGRVQGMARWLLTESYPHGRLAASMASDESVAQWSEDRLEASVSRHEAPAQAGQPAGIAALDGRATPAGEPEIAKGMVGSR